MLEQLFKRGFPLVHIMGRVVKVVSFRVELVLEFKKFCVKLLLLWKKCTLSEMLSVIF